MNDPYLRAAAKFPEVHAQALEQRDKRRAERLNMTPDLPPAQNVGQEWTSPGGTLYRVAQAFDENGQFLPDNPETPPRESLRWVVVEP